MKNTLNKLEELIKSGAKYIENTSSDLRCKSSLIKWSKQEILGHLIDSGINNLQRFTEIQFKDKPYIIKNYNQKELVKANDYQNSKREEILCFLVSINRQIIYVIKQQTKDTLNYKIKLETNEVYNLRFLIIDYVEHLEYHLKQIME